ncbi:Protein apterous [Eumeta japonica]|uniref:Protein apterous n=1 Tax=Eumeta variegata TaxID=151549 RepID=A0A4C1SSK9_EUMVA|nr:Protein apterous [Eumeta japonica]
MPLYSYPSDVLLAVNVGLQLQPSRSSLKIGVFGKASFTNVEYVTTSILASAGTMPYVLLFGSKRCSRCQATISATELVMRARDLVFHVHCFTCALCNSPLTKGDTFGIRDSAVYCKLHYETMPEYAPHMGVPGPPHMCPGPYGGPPPAPHYPPYPSPDFPRAEPEVPKTPFYNGAAPPPRQKGRPRKKKPKDQEIMTANLGE